VRVFLLVVHLLFVCGAIYAQGHALLFDGVDDRATIPDDYGDLDLGSSLTLESWVKPFATGPWEPVIQGEFNTSGYLSWGISLSDAGGWKCAIIASGVADLAYSPPGSITLGEWHHLVCTYDGTTIRIYQDGQPIASQVHSYGGPTMEVIRAMLGWYWPEFYLGGTIDEVSVWNVVRSKSEIAMDSLRCISGMEPGLAGLWRLDEGDQQVVTDSSGNNNHGWLGSNGTVQDSDPLWVLSDAPLPCYVFTDGFESGDTSAWSSTVP